MYGEATDSSAAGLDAVHDVREHAPQLVHLRLCFACDSWPDQDAIETAVFKALTTGSKVDDTLPCFCNVSSIVVTADTGE